MSEISTAQPTGLARREKPRRGLVIGAGGVLGGAWALGALAALRDVHGFEPRDAEVLVGTSAGSVLAALFGAGATVQELVDHESGRSVKTGPIAGFNWDIKAVTGGSRPGRPKLQPGSRALLSTGFRRMRQLPPTAVLSAFLPTGSKTLDRVSHVVEAFTPMGEWSPHPNVWIVAMDYDTGQRTVFGREGDPISPLSLAVQSSCSIPAWYSPVVIDGHRYVDGGACSANSVDIVANLGLDEVFVVAPMVSFHLDRPSRLITRIERTWRMKVTKRCLNEVEKVRRGGAEVTVLAPGAEDLAAIGGNLMDFAKRQFVLETSIRTSLAALRDPDNYGPDYLAHVG
jgi:NTE family protein